ncbi:MAG TPA: cell division ATP-binding protein FtsE [Candidatus Acidoferrales bacterium]|nr:cell division ATP-binding protein FtsE [Candidatus Acidoferrales bacterium]
MKFVVLDTSDTLDTYDTLTTMIRFENVTKQYPTGNTALEDISFTIDRGEFVFVIGPSGSGKTTLFRLLINDEMPSSGSIFIGDWDLTNLPKKKIPVLRKNIGVVFQDLKLLRDRTIYENIMFPLEVGDIDSHEARERVDGIIERVGISEHRDKFPIQLSGGELQRAAIARALAFSPEIILADEPTGNLDNATSWEIIKLLQDINESGTTILMATHNADIVNSLRNRTLILEKGKLTKDQASKHKKPEHKEHKE